MRSRRWKYFGVLVCLLYLFVIAPFLRPDYGKPALSLLIAASIWAISDRIWALRIGLVLGVPAIGLSLIESRPWSEIGNLLIIIFLIFVTIAIQGDLAKGKDVNLDTLFGAVVGYLMLATIFAILFTLLEGFVPGSFSAPNRDISITFQTMLYFSMVTISTLGYGDITPLTPGSQSLAALEAVIGQFYFALLVARLMALYLQSRTGRPGPPSTPEISPKERIITS